MNRMTEQEWRAASTARPFMAVYPDTPIPTRDNGSARATEVLAARATQRRAALDEVRRVAAQTAALRQAEIDAARAALTPPPDRPATPARLPLPWWRRMAGGMFRG